MVATSCKKHCVFGCGTALLLIGAILGGLWGIIYDRLLRMELTLTNSSRSYQIWKDIPIPIYLEFYMYNWTNAEEMLHNHNIKPHFTEMGPYVFREYHHRVNITWNSNDTVTYRQVRSWHFQPDKSNGSLSDKVTNLNMIASTVAFQTRFLNAIELIALNLLVKAARTKLFVTKSVKELLFDGYDDRLLDLVKNISHVPFSRFGYFVERNNSATADGIFTMWTGKSDFLDLGMITRWNLKENTGLYPQPCDKVQGSSGDLWPPVYGRNNVQIFASDLCFAVELASVGDTETHGIPGLRFVGNNRTFDNGTHFPEARCQCVGECQPYGTLNASACRFGSPLFVSFPHFYLADPVYLEPLQGLQPSAQKHQFAVELQPKTGMPLHVEAKLQLNVMVKAWPHIGIFKSMPRNPIFMPMLWFVQRADLPSDLVSQVRTLVLFDTAGRGTLIGIACIGAFILLIGILLTLRHEWSRKEVEDTSRLLVSENVENNSNEFHRKEVENTS